MLPTRPSISLIAFFLASLCATDAARAQTLRLPGDATPSQSASVDDDSDRPAVDSPRASMTRYVDLCRRQRWADAGRFLDMPHGRHGDPATLARELFDVLDRYVGLEPDLLSAVSRGDPDDGQPPGIDLVGSVPSPDGTRGFVRIGRRDEADGARWVFTRDTVARIDGWYSELGGRWAREHLPRWMLRRGPRDLLVWQWLALCGLIVGALFAGKVLGWATRGAILYFTRRAHPLWHSALRRAATPFTAAYLLLIVDLGLPWLSLYRAADEFVRQVLRAGFDGVFYLVLWHSTEVLAQALATSPWASSHPGAVTVVPLVTRFARVLVVVAATIAVLSQLGYPVASLVAGLGIGGLALALAAQKTGEHLFGSIAIGVDQPFRVGDFIKVDEFSGTVETVGLRSTRIRTLDRTVITLPNGKLADMRIETYAPRDRIRLYCILGLPHDTKVAQVRAVLVAMRAVLDAHPLVWAEGASVTLKSISESSLELEVIAWFRTTSWDAFTVVRQDVLLDLLAIIEREGGGLAHPERTIRIVDGTTATRKG